MEFLHVLFVDDALLDPVELLGRFFGWNLEPLLLLDDSSLVDTTVKVSEDLVHLGNEGGVPGEVLDLLIGHDESSDSLGEVDEQGGVADVVAGDLGGVGLDRLEVLLLSGAENGESEDRVPGHRSSVLREHAVEDSHVELEVEDELGVSHEIGEFFLHSAFFPLVSLG